MTSVLKIGRTNYYSVRKGTQQYCIAEGKRLQDAEYCWQTVKDPSTGKTFFLSGAGVRRWHLPDIHLTEKERQEEEKELRFRREQKAIEDARLARQKAGDEALLNAEGEVQHKTDSEVADADERFAARDRAAMSARMLQGWETPEQRRPVARFVKSVLQPHIGQGLLDEKSFTQLVTTLTREHCSAVPPPFGADHEAQLRETSLQAAKQRVDEERKKAEYEKLTDELKDKVRRLEAEKRKMQSQIDTLEASEESMKDELFSLRAHKQDTLLTGFKRLTRVGLINAYWERWTKYKSVVEAQLHVKARERRQQETTDRVRELLEKVRELESSNAVLRNRVQQQQGRDVVATLMHAHGKNVMKRVYLKWKEWAEKSSKERKFFELQKQLSDCPQCKLRGVEVERLHERLALEVNQSREREHRFAQMESEFHETLRKLAEAEKKVQEYTLQLDERGEASSTIAAQLRNEQAYSSKLEQKVRTLAEELERLNYEARQYYKPDRAMACEVKGRTVKAVAGLSTGIEQSVEQQPQGIASFFHDEATRAAQTSYSKNSQKPYAGVPAAEKATVGAISIATEAAIAPTVFGDDPPNPLRHFDSSDVLQHDILKKPRGQLMNPQSLTKKSVVVDKIRAGKASSDDSTSSSSDDDSSSDSSSSSSRSSDDSHSVAVDDQERRRGDAFSTTTLSDPLQTGGQRCEACGFDKSLTAFCPKDGSRHLFVSLSGDRYDPHSSMMTSSFHSILAGPPAKRDAGGKVLQLPPGRQVFPDGTVSSQRNAKGSDADDGAQSKPLPVLPHTAALRASLSLDPKTFKPIIFQSNNNVFLGEPRSGDLANTREVAEYMRNTQLTTAANTRQASQRIGGLTSNLHRDVYPSLSLDSRMYLSNKEDDTPKEGSITQPKTRWSGIFDASETYGALSGMVPQNDTVFGVYRRDELSDQSREHLRKQDVARKLEQQKQNTSDLVGTPNLMFRAR